MVESFGALVAITLTMLLASIQGPSGDSPRSIFDSNAFASLVSLTEGRACSPTSCRIRTDAFSSFIPIISHHTGLNSSAVRRTSQAALRGRPSARPSLRCRGRRPRNETQSRFLRFFSYTTFHDVCDGVDDQFG